MRSTVIGLGRLGGPAFAAKHRTEVFPLLKRAVWHLGCVMATMAVAGCAPTLNIRAVPEELPVATHWPANAPPAERQGIRPVELPWRDYVADEQLRALIEKALANNRDLRLALLRVEEARAAHGIQRSEQFPMIGLTGVGARARVPGDLSLTGEPAIHEVAGLAVGLTSWELDLWGRVRSLNEAALQNYLATDHAQRAVRASVIAAVAQGYLSLRDYDERIALANQTIASRAESYRIFRRRNEMGSTSDLELTQVETLLIQARTLGTQLQQARAAQAHALTQLVGAPIVPLTIAEPSLRDEAIFASLDAGLPSDLLTARPDIIAAERQLAAANANIRAARAAFFPRIALTGNFGTLSAELDGLFESGSRTWVFAPTISLPIFDGGRRRAALDLTEVRSDIAVASYEKTIQNAFREVADALSARQALAQLVEQLRQARDVQDRRARLAQLRYDSGAAAYLEVLDAQRNQLEAQQQLVQVRRQLLASQVALYAALGGGADFDRTVESSAGSPSNPSLTTRATHQE